VISGVTKDASSGKYVPSSLTEWNAFIAATGLTLSAPTSTWPFQEPSGSPVDVISAINLTAGGTVTYSNPVPGWTRKSCDVAAGGTNQFTSTSASLPDVLTTSMTVLMYWRAPTATPASQQTALFLGPLAKGGATSVTNTPQHNWNIGANASLGASPIGRVMPVVARIDVTNSIGRCYTDQDKLAPLWDPPTTGKRIGFGTNPSADGGYLYAAMWSGAAAEISDANVKRLLQALGWTVPWS
jgi:hypothetical protein